MRMDGRREIPSNRSFNTGTKKTQGRSEKGAKDLLSEAGEGSAMSALLKDT